MKRLTVKSSRRFKAVYKRGRSFVSGELVTYVLKNGITVTGGGALIKNIDKAIEQAIGVPVRIADEPLDCVVLGTEIASENENILMRSLVARHG